MKLCFKKYESFIDVVKWYIMIFKIGPQKLVTLYIKESLHVYFLL